MKAAFITNRTLRTFGYVFRHYQIVLRHSKLMMNHLLPGLISKGQVVIYMDDIFDRSPPLSKNIVNCSRGVTDLTQK